MSAAMLFSFDCFALMTLRLLYRELGSATSRCLQHALLVLQQLPKHSTALTSLASFHSLSSLSRPSFDG